MELLLNVSWLAVSLSLACLWLRTRARGGKGLLVEIAALAVLILLLLPVISVSDDLMALQNLAETDCCQRKMQQGGCHSPAHLPVAGLPEPVTLGYDLMPVWSILLANPEPVTHSTRWAPIVQSRPPPAA